jgi:hypothetical protein
VKNQQESQNSLGLSTLQAVRQYEVGNKDFGTIRGFLAQLGERQTEDSIESRLLQVSGSIPEKANLLSFLSFSFSFPALPKFEGLSFSASFPRAIAASQGVLCDIAATAKDESGNSRSRESARKLNFVHISCIVRSTALFPCCI